jgi:octaprenyl-diphosphate synthase
MSVASAKIAVRGERSAGLGDILSLVEPDLLRVEAMLEQHLRSDVGLVNEIARYVRAGGGKRIRPGLLLLASQMCGHASERAVLFASVVELLHTATLLHDDIIDGAELRRGQRTVSRRWGSDVSVLLGDFMFAKSFEMALAPENVPLVRLLTEVALRMIEGETIEIARRASSVVTEAENLDLIRRKTADLFSACARIGGVLGDASDAEARALAGYGLNLGICFQMVDDLLDFTGSEARLGKPVASDLREGRVTLPIILLLRSGKADAVQQVEAVLADRGFERVTREQIVRLVQESGVLEDARRVAERYADAACAELAAFEDSPYRRALAELAAFTVKREY